MSEAIALRLRSDDRWARGLLSALVIIDVCFLAGALRLLHRRDHALARRVIPPHAMTFDTEAL
jgi:hypothetical protein